jgi:hypothetical protein
MDAEVLAPDRSPAVPPATQSVTFDPEASKMIADGRRRRSREVTNSPAPLQGSAQHRLQEASRSRGR